MMIAATTSCGGGQATDVTAATEPATAGYVYVWDVTLPVLDGRRGPAGATDDQDEAFEAMQRALTYCAPGSLGIVREIGLRPCQGKKLPMDIVGKARIHPQTGEVTWMCQ